MADIDLGQLFAAALGGGVTVKLLDIGYQEITRRLVHAKTTQQFVDQHFDPLLKATDELFGKLRALVERDFKPIWDVEADEKCLANPDFGSLVYLTGIFWARIERIRQDGMSVVMGKDARGKKLQSFFNCLESRRVRIIDRIQQRAIGECLLNGRETKSFTEFVNAFERDESIRRWLMPLVRTLSRTRHTTERQALLQYSVVLHAMIDTLDPRHLITSDRPAVANKLTSRSWGDLNYRVFRVYLKFVRNAPKYVGPPKRAAQQKKGRQRERTLEKHQ